MPGQRRPVLHPRPVTVSLHPWQVQQHREAGGALDERPGRRAVEPQDQVALPVAGDGPVVGLGRPLTDHHLGADELLAARLRARTRHSQRAPGAETGDELALERAPALHVEGLVDRLMRDPHRVILGEVDPEPIRDLLRTPRRCPAPVLTTAVPTTSKAHFWAGHRLAVGPRDRADEPLLHVLAQRVIAEREGSRSLPAQQMRDNAPTAGPTRLAASRHRLGTTGCQPPATLPPRRPPP